jgi:hypothetical protein
LVVDLPLWKIWKSVGIILHNIYIWYGKINIMFQTIYQMRNDRSLFARMRSVRGLPHCTRLWSP